MTELEEDALLASERQADVDAEEHHLYSFSRDDRITYNGIEVRYEQTVKKGYLVYEDTVPPRYDLIPHAGFTDLLKDRKKLRIDRNYFSLSKIKLRHEGKLLPLGELEDDEAADTYFKYELVMTWRTFRETLPFSTPERDQVALTEAFNRVRLKAFLSDNASKLARRVSATPLSTLLSWHQRLQSYGDDPRSLIDGRVMGSGNRSPRFPPEVRAALQRAVDGYLDTKKPTVKSLWKDLEDEIHELNKPRLLAGMETFLVPHLKTLGRRIAKLDKFLVMAMRYSPEKAEAKYRSTYGGLWSVRPGERLEVDGWLCHLHVLLEKNDVWMALPADVRERLKTVRITFIVVIDSATRCILAIKFAWSENAKAIRDAVRLAMEDKTNIAKAFGCKSTWSMHGWGSWVHDNNPAFTEAAVLEAVLKGLGKDQHSPAGIPWLRGRVERFFQTISTKLLGHFLGQTGSDPRDRNAFEQAGYATVTYEELVELTVLWVVDEYHNEKHDGLGVSPRKAWFKLCQVAPPAPPHGPDRLIEIFGEIEELSLTGSGITVANTQYQSLELQNLLRATGLGKKRPVKIDYQNLGMILVEIPEHLVDRNDPNAEPWMVVSAPPEAEFDGLSLRHLDMVDDEMAMRFGYDDATSDAIRREARRTIKAFARDAAKLRLTETGVDLEVARKRRVKSFHPALWHGDSNFLAAQLEELHAPVALAKTAVDLPGEPDPTAAVPFIFNKDLP